MRQQDSEETDEDDSDSCLSLVASSSESESEDEVTTNKVRKKSSDKSKKYSKSAPKPSLLQKWLVEKVANADEDDSDFKGGITKVSRGLKQSKVAGEVQPLAHERERQRRVKIYIPKPGKTKLGGKRSTDPKHILAVDRVKDNPDQGFEAKKGNILYCKACSTEVSLKAASIKTHIRVIIKHGYILVSFNFIARQ